MLRLIIHAVLSLVKVLFCRLTFTHRQQSDIVFLSFLFSRHSLT